jgi:hypothetical protein
MSNTGSTCNGSNLNAAMGDAAGTNNGCGNIQNSNVPVVTDPYSGLASNIPANPCHTYRPSQRSRTIRRSRPPTNGRGAFPTAVAITLFAATSS